MINNSFKQFYLQKCSRLLSNGRELASMQPLLVQSTDVCFKENIKICFIFTWRQTNVFMANVCRKKFSKIPWHIQGLLYYFIKSQNSLLSSAQFVRKVCKIEGHCSLYIAYSVKKRNYMTITNISLLWVSTENLKF